MAIEVPATPKVYTTTYDNFKGVDFTNDSTNVWRRRSPTGTNMLPDASGRPMKRNGWEVLLSNEDLCTALSVDSCSVLKCAYFELAGKDHIVIFTDCGVVFYNEEDTGTGMTLDGVTAICTEADCYMSFDRCFFFEGNGTSAFYIYGNFRVWKYGYENDYFFTEMTNNLTIPTLTILTSADGVGEFYQGYNLLGSMISVKYNDTDLFTYWGSDGLDFSIDKAKYISGKTKNHYQLYEYNNGSWSSTFPTDSLILSSTPKNGDQIYVIYANGVVLPNNFNVAGQSDLSEVWYTKTSEFDVKLNLETASNPATDEFRPHADPVNRANKRAWIEFNPSQNFGNPDGTVDYIKVTAPATEVETQQYTETLSETATFNGEVV